MVKNHVTSLCSQLWAKTGLKIEESVKLDTFRHIYKISWDLLPYWAETLEQDEHERHFTKSVLVLWVCHLWALL